jgi:hypothetical protein
MTPEKIEQLPYVDPKVSQYELNGKNIVLKGGVLDECHKQEEKKYQKQNAAEHSHSYIPENPKPTIKEPAPKPTTKEPAPKPNPKDLPPKPAKIPGPFNIGERMAEKDPEIDKDAITHTSYGKPQQPKSRRSHRSNKPKEPGIIDKGLSFLGFKKKEEPKKEERNYMKENQEK